MRDLLGGLPAARTQDAPDEPETGWPGESEAWQPGADFELQVPAAPRPERSAQDWRARLRWDPGRRGAAALGLALVAVVAATGWWLAAGRPHAEPVAASSSLPPGAAMATSTPTGDTGTDESTATLTASVPVSSAPASGAVSSSATSIVVDVAGRVRHPGVYTLPPGARVEDAVRAAGGVRRGVSTLSINLAAPVQDGEQVVIGVPGMAPQSEPAPAPTSEAVASSGTDGTGGTIDLNTATLEQLEALPGVGPVLAQNILDYRSADGPFTSVGQLDDVPGIGPARLAQLQPLVTI